MENKGPHPRVTCSYVKSCDQRKKGRKKRRKAHDVLVLVLVLVLVYVVPEGQFKYDDDPVVFAYVPAAQGVHVAWYPVDEVSTGHLMHDADSDLE